MKILLAEDSLVMRRLLLGLLKQWDYEVLEAENGAQAFELFQRQPVPMVLTDWIMPELDGLELIRRIRSFDAPGYVYVVLLTSKSEKEDLITGMETGADDFLVKPVDQGELRVRLREGERIIRLEHSLAEKNRALRETQAALVQQEKLAGLGQLAAGMAHEINNPIAFVSNNVTVLKREFGSLTKVLHKYRECKEAVARANPALAAELDDLENELEVTWIEDNMPRVLETCSEGLVRVSDIVNNLRDFARLDEAKFNEVNLNKALDSTIEMLHSELSKNEIHILKQYEDLPLVPCYSGKINQVFLNLLLNAIQASNSGAEIEIRTRTEENHVAVELADHGSGIDPEHLPHIFEPFFTTRQVGQGKGLGLAISYGIVSDHQGTITVDSKPGQGSTFCIRLPLTAKEQ